MARAVQQGLLVAAMFASASAFIVLRGSLFNPACPKVPVKQNFDVTRYMGKWWEYKRFPAPFEFGGVCGFANYTLLPNNKIKVLNSGIQEIKLWRWVLSRKRDTAEGEAAIVNPAEPSRLQVSFGGMPAGSGEANYFLVDTDYDNFAVVFSCSEIVIGNIQFLWILTRQQGVAPANLAQIEATLRNAGVDLSPFITVDHSDRACNAPLFG